jgi:hypothetical protein
MTGSVDRGASSNAPCFNANLQRHRTEGTLRSSPGPRRPLRANTLFFNANLQRHRARKVRRGRALGQDRGAHDRGRGSGCARAAAAAVRLRSVAVHRRPAAAPPRPTAAPPLPSPPTHRCTAPWNRAPPHRCTANVAGHARLHRRFAATPAPASRDAARAPPRFAQVRRHMLQRHNSTPCFNARQVRGKGHAQFVEALTPWLQRPAATPSRARARA